MNGKENWYESMRMELRSRVFRFIGFDRLKLKFNENYLNLGCGPNIIDGMVNADFFQSLNPFSKRKNIQWELDLRYPLKANAEVFDGVFCSHVLEHLYPDENKKLLRELFRVMKPDSRIRIVVPDLELYVNFYSGKLSTDKAAQFSERFAGGSDAIRNLSQNYFHRMVWDFDQLASFLKEAGFSRIEKRKYQDSDVQGINLDIKDRDWESLYVEAVR